MRARIGVLVTLLATGPLACQPTPMKPVQAPTEPQTALEDFSPERAWGHLEALTAIGPRASGTQGAARARAYIVDQLDEVGLEVEEQTFTVSFESDLADLEMVNLLVTIPGASDDLFVLATPYDTRYFSSFRFVGANAGGSGAALLLELARVIAKYPLPYTTRLAFLDAEAPLGRGAEEDLEGALLGSTTLARSWQAADVLPRIRLLVYLDRVGDADLKISRDLYSHRPYREIFWDSGAELGYTDAFEPARPYESPRGGHHAFLETGVRRVTAVVDLSFGGEEPPGLYANTEDDTIERCSPESFDAVGRVTLLSLDTIGERLAKVDRFSGAPLQEPPPEEAPAPADPVASSAEEAPVAPAADAQEPIPSPSAGDNMGRAWAH